MPAPTSTVEITQKPGLLAHLAFVQKLVPVLKPKGRLKSGSNKWTDTYLARRPLSGSLAE